MVLRTFTTGILLAAGAFAQMSSFPKPNYFREVLQQSRTKVELRDPVRLKDFVVSGKIELSLKNYLELVMANNTDVQVTFLSLEIPKNNITAAYGRFDPAARVSFSTSRATSIPTDPTQAKTAGAITKSLAQQFPLSYTQALDTGTSYTFSFNGSKNDSSNSLSNYNPNLKSSMSFAVTQSLLQNRGRYVNRLPIMQAQSSYRRSEFNLRATVLNLINNAESAYWRVVSARESVHVQEEARKASQANLDFVQQQLTLGAISPLDIYNPQGQLAAAELALSQAKFSLAQAEDAIRHQIGVDLDPEIRKLPIDLTEPVDITTDSLNLDAEKSVEKALSVNPNVSFANQSLDLDDLGIQSAKNGLLPQLSFTASYQSAGQGGIFYPGQTSFFGGGTGGTIEPIPGGIADALSQMFGFGYPTYTGSLTLQLPIRSRTASMNMANALVQKKTDALNLRNIQQNTRLNVLNAVTNLQGAIESLKLAKKQDELQQKNYDAEVQKYTLGTDINQNVVIALQNKVVADSQVVTAQVNVRTSILNLYTQTGELLDERGIVIK